MTFGDPKSIAKPHKRPKQERSRFTVQVIFDTFVRILEREGWDGVTMRNIAEESGYAVGTIYDYFPDKYALLSGYVKFAFEARISAMENGIDPNNSWRNEVKNLVDKMFDTSALLPSLVPEMIALEHRVADRERHERAFFQLVKVWTKMSSHYSELAKVTDEDIKYIVTTSWGAWRYNAVLSGNDFRPGDFVTRTREIVIFILEAKLA